MLYFGPCMAGRTAVLGDFAREHGAHCDATVRDIIPGAGRWSAVDSFRTRCRIREIRAMAARDFAAMDMFLLTTTQHTFTIEEVRRDPARTNMRMAAHANFVNILDLCAVAVPAALTTLPGTDAVMPFGVTMVVPVFAETRLLSLAAAFHERSRIEEALPLGSSVASAAGGA